MKIVRDNKVYVQKDDIAKLMDVLSISFISIPGNVFNQIYENIFICTEENKRDFVSFDGEEAIAFFRKLYYIPDYDELKDKSLEELEGYVDILNDEISLMTRRNNLISQNRKIAIVGPGFNNPKSIIHIKVLKKQGIEDYINYRKGIINIDFPNEIIEQNNKEKRLLRRIFKK